MTYVTSILANSTFCVLAPAVPNIKLGFCHDPVASNKCLPSYILCNLATVSKNGLILIVPPIAPPISTSAAKSPTVRKTGNLPDRR